MMEFNSNAEYLKAFPPKIDPPRLDADCALPHKGRQALCSKWQNGVRMASKRVLEECSREEMEDDLGVGEEEEVMLPEVATASNGLWRQPCTGAPEIVLPSEREVDDWMVDPQPYEKQAVETEGEVQPVTVQELIEADEENMIHQDLEAAILEKLKQNVNIVDEPAAAVEEPGDTPQKVDELGGLEEEEMNARALSDGGVYV